MNGLETILSLGPLTDQFKVTELPVMFETLIEDIEGFVGQLFIVTEDPTSKFPSPGFV